MKGVKSACFVSELQKKPCSPFKFLHKLTLMMSVLPTNTFIKRGEHYIPMQFHSVYVQMGVEKIKQAVEISKIVKLIESDIRETRQELQDELQNDSNFNRLLNIEFRFTPEFQVGDTVVIKHNGKFYEADSQGIDNIPKLHVASVLYEVMISA